MASLVKMKDLLVDPRSAAMHAANEAETESLRRLGGGSANIGAVAAFGEKRPADVLDL
jgi:hypothetical protein